MTIEIQVPENYQPLVDAQLLKQAVECVLAAERSQGDVTVIITDDETVARLNQEFLGKSGATDVLSFPAQDETEDFILPPDAATEPYLGDIIIALPYTQRQAQQLGRELREELALLTIHGALHLLGYDHATPEEKADMWQRQNAIITGLGLNPSED